MCAFPRRYDVSALGDVSCPVMGAFAEDDLMVRYHESITPCAFLVDDLGY